MQKWGHAANTLHAAALASHVACCGIPLALNVVALAFGAGLLSFSSPWVEAAHGALHAREGLFVAVSAGLVALGGAAQYIAWRSANRRGDCALHDHAPRRVRGNWVFGLVCLLFVGNLALFAWHQSQPAMPTGAHVHEAA